MKIKLFDLPAGSLFFYDNSLALKSEYVSNSGAVQSFLLDSGEMFWGGTNNAKDLNNLEVFPIKSIWDLQKAFHDMHDLLRDIDIYADQPEQSGWNVKNCSKIATDGLNKLYKEYPDLFLQTNHKNTMLKHKITKVGVVFFDKDGNKNAIVKGVNMDKHKTATECLFESGINTMSMDDTFNSQLLHAMERYAEEKVKYGEGSERYWKKQFEAMRQAMESYCKHLEKHGKANGNSFYTLFKSCLELKSSIGEETEGQDGWISVEERLPDKNSYYICWLDSPSEQGLIHYHKDTGWQNGFYNDRVTHYQILIPPKPTK